MTNVNCDSAIIGGGPVGAALAIEIADLYGTFEVENALARLVQLFAAEIQAGS